MDVGLILYDQNLRYQFWNSFMEKLSGVPSEKILGKFALDLFPHLREQGVDKLLERALAGETVSSEDISYYVPQSGKRGWVSGRYSPHRNGEGEILGVVGILTDITRQKEIEKALQEREEHLNITLLSIGDGIIVTDEKGLVTLINPVTEELTGWAHEEAQGQPLEEVFHIINSHSRKKVQNPVQKVIKDGKTVGLANHTVLVSRTGKEYQIADSASPLLHGDGTVRGVVLVFRDITEKYEMDRQLKERESVLLESQEVAQVGSYVLDVPSGQWKGSKVLDSIFGIDEKCEHTIEIWVSLLHPEWRETMVEYFQREVVQRGNFFDREYKIIRASDGQERWVYGRGRLQFDSQGKPLKMIGTIQDITGWKESEIALMESEEKYRLLVENGSDGLFIVQDEVIKFPNPQAVALSGYSKEELAEISLADLIYPDDREIFMDWCQRKTAGEKVVPAFSFRIIQKGGQILWGELTFVTIQWEEKPATLNFLRDITVQRNLESQFQQAQRMEAVGTLAGGIAHNFNNILTVIQANSSFLLAKKDPSDRDCPHLEDIQQSVETAAHLTKQLLGFARGGKYDTEVINLNDLTNQTSKMFGNTKKEVTLHSHYPEDLWPIEANTGQMEQVLLNLLINAWQAMPGGGEIFLETKNISLRDGLTYPFKVSSGRYVKLSVADTGFGMDEEIQQRVFEPFFTTKDVGQGTGLGLSSVYGIVRSHGGFINLHSARGEGSVFEIFLPASEKELLKRRELKTDCLKGFETILLGAVFLWTGKR